MDWTDFDADKQATIMLALRCASRSPPTSSAHTWGWWGRAIFFADDVDAQFAQVVSAGLAPEFSPRDGSWGERYFHIVDPDGHEISFARPIRHTLAGCLGFAAKLTN